jgi:class 3 adenylate cyclase
VLCCAEDGLSQYESAPGAPDIERVMPSWPDRAENGSVWSGRTNRAIVYGDVRGFSGVPEALQPRFFEKIIGGFGDALAFVRPSIDYAETAGDGIYLVLRDVGVAVQVCRALHDVMAPARLKEAGMPADMALRLSAHFGPLFRGVDRVTGRAKFFGGEVIRTARIEPVTPAGETYVTEQFAAELFRTANGLFECEYVGVQAMAKDYGACRMYSLRAKAG